MLIVPAKILPPLLISIGTALCSWKIHQLMVYMTIRGWPVSASVDEDPLHLQSGATHLWTFTAGSLMQELWQSVYHCHHYQGYSYRLQNLSVFGYLRLTFHAIRTFAQISTIRPESKRPSGKLIKFKWDLQTPISRLNYSPAFSNIL